jgi:hypothetical protein
MNKLIADIQVGPLQGVGPLGAPGGNASFLFSSTLSKIIGVITVVGFIWFTFQVIFGAVRIIASGGDKAAVESARKQITTGIIGVVVMVSGIFIVSLVGQLLGINNILNPLCIIENVC